MSDVTVSFGAKDDGLKAALAGTEKGIGKINKAFSGLAVAIAGAVSIREVAGYLSDAISAASNLAETQSKVGQIFGKSAIEIEDWAKGSARALGQSNQQAMDAAATFAIFGKSAGLSGGELVNFSTKLTGLAADIASFSNATPQEAIEAIGSALRGEAEPMRRFGVLLDDASLRSEALKMGLISTTKEALTPQQKVLASYNLILSQTANAQGDFERTSGGLANQQRILAAEFANLSVQVGEIMLPAMQDATTWMTNVLVPALKNSATEAGFTAKGISLMAESLSGIKDISFGSIENDLAAGAGFMAALKAAVPIFGAGSLLNDAIGAAGGALKAKGQEANAADAPKPAEAIKEADVALQSLAETASNLKLDGLGPIPELMEKGVSLLDDQGVRLEQHLDLYDAQKNLAETLLKTDEQRAKAAENGAAAESKRLDDLRSQAAERASAANGRLSTIAGLDPKEFRGERNRINAARKAQEKLERADNLSQLKGVGTAEERKLRRDAAKILEKNGLGEVNKADQYLKTIDSNIAQLVKQLPTPALAP